MRSTYQVSRLHTYTAPVKTVHLTAHKHLQDVIINQKAEFQNNQHDILKLELKFSTREPWYGPFC